MTGIVSRGAGKVDIGESGGYSHQQRYAAIER